MLLFRGTIRKRKAKVKNGRAPAIPASSAARPRSEEHTSELQSQSNLVCRLLLEKKHLRLDRVVLEHHRDVAVLGRPVVDDLVTDPELTVGDVLEADDHPEYRRLTVGVRLHRDHV